MARSTPAAAAAAAAAVVTFTIAAVAGVFSRIELTRLTQLLSNDDASGFILVTRSFLLPNMVGCLVMGILTGKAESSQPLPAYMHTALSTAYAGSLTTFASLCVRSYDLFAEANVIDGLLAIMVTVLIGLDCYRFGIHLFTIYNAASPTTDVPLASSPSTTPTPTPTAVVVVTKVVVVKNNNNNDEDATPNTTAATSSTKSRHDFAVYGCVVVVCVVCMIVFIVDVSNDGTSSVTHVGEAIVWAPLGAFVRHMLSKLNTIHHHYLHPGTLATNMLGAMVAAIALTSQSSLRDAITPGLAGSISTVSTWVKEISKLTRAHAWIYACLSVLLGLGVVGVVEVIK